MKALAAAFMLMMVVGCAGQEYRGICAIVDNGEVMLSNSEEVPAVRVICKSFE